MSSLSSTRDDLGIPVYVCATSQPGGKGMEEAKISEVLDLRNPTSKHYHLVVQDPQEGAVLVSHPTWETRGAGVRALVMAVRELASLDDPKIANILNSYGIQYRSTPKEDEQ